MYIQELIAAFAVHAVVPLAASANWSVFEIDSCAWLAKRSRALARVSSSFLLLSSSFCSMFVSVFPRYISRADMFLIRLAWTSANCFCFASRVRIYASLPSSYLLAALAFVTAGMVVERKPCDFGDEFHNKEDGC